MRWPYFIGVLVGLIAIDQTYKHVAINQNEAASIYINSASGFSLLTHQPALVIGGVLLVILLVIQAIQVPSTRGAAALVIAGGVSNLIDRIVIGGAVDTLHIRNISLNIADIAIVLGVTILALGLIQKKDRK